MPGSRPNVYFHLRGKRDLASSRVRGFDLAERLGSEADVHVKGGRERIRPDAALWKADVLYFQKTTQLSDWVLAAAARLAGADRLVFDVDDALHLDSRDAARVDARQKALQDRMLRKADVVTVGSHALLDYARPLARDVRLARTPIDLARYPVKAHDPDVASGPLTVGWLGSGSAYGEDLKMLVGPLRALARARPLRLRVVGAQGNPVIHGAFAPLAREGVEVEVLDGIDWGRPGAVGEAIASFDVGVYPLRDVPYNLYKGGFKLLEYMACGVPAVASPVGETRHLLEESGIGLAARTEEEWTRGLERLLGDAKERARRGADGRARVEGHHGYDAFLRIAKGALGLEP